MSMPNEFLLHLTSGSTVTLKDGTILRAEDLIQFTMNTADGAFAEVSQNPNDPTILGLKNLTKHAWTATLADGSSRQVEPGRNIKLANNTTLNLGPVAGTLRKTSAGFSLALSSGLAVPLRIGQKVTTSALFGQKGPAPIAEVTRNPHDPTILGLKNLTSHAWTAVGPDGTSHSVVPGKNIKLAVGTRINFGGIKGEVTLTRERSFWRYSLPAGFHYLPALWTVSRQRWQVVGALATALILVYLGWAALLFPTWFEHRMRTALKIEEANDPAVIEHVRQIAAAPTTLALAAQLQQQLSQSSASTDDTLPSAYSESLSESSDITSP